MCLVIFNRKFPDILLELKLQQKPKMQSIDFVYKWNAVHDESKQIVFNFIIDSNTQRKKRTELKIHFPGQDVTFTGEIQQTGKIRFSWEVYIILYPVLLLLLWCYVGCV